MSEAQPQSEQSQRPMPEQAMNWFQRFWRPAGTAMAVVLALLLTWHVIDGKNGIMAWRLKRAQDQQLRLEIDSLQQENTHLRAHIDRLKTDPSAMEHEAREKLHYTRPGEVIYTLPADPKNAPVPQTQPISER